VGARMSFHGDRGKQKTSGRGLNWGGEGEKRGKGGTAIMIGGDGAVVVKGTGSVISVRNHLRGDAGGN